VAGQRRLAVVYPGVGLDGLMEGQRITVVLSFWGSRGCESSRRRSRDTEAGLGDRIYAELKGDLGKAPQWWNCQAGVVL
jgi:hypothetical protein